ncbi:ABC transporter permease [Nonomuraea turkmeniaca]|uniref:ABC transporter permease n=1 Tax=Nonomuraea turkmeniaca TaxID=103838 RepID=A0A5S4FF91_9ACTN|nr:ABC transporter permease [Nonomuraea turkmeniaca]TMR17359.1 ABC transporter permease [Nonomuraea turkmeniaca]
MSGLMAVKLRRDLRASWSRFVLMVIAIAVSLTVFGGILSAWASVGRETTGAYMSTGPASATIVLQKGLPPERMAALAAAARERGGVLEATGRGQFTGQIVGKTIPLQVFLAAPQDPMRMARFDVRQPSAGWPPAAGDVLIRRDSLPLLGVTVGDTVTVTAPGSEPVRLRVAGAVYDPSLAPSRQEQKGFGYLSTASLATPLLDQLKIQVAEPGQDVPTPNRDTVVAMAGDIARWLQDEQRVAVREIQAPRPYAHPHQWQSDALMGSLLAGAALALLLSSILVATMLNTLFTQQIPQIGIMKAIGARSGRIARLYLVMTLVVAAVATLLALLPAVLLGRDRLESSLQNLGIEATSLAAPWWTYALILLAGLALPPLISLIPLVKASRTTVRAAIDHHGGASNPSGVVARLSRLRGLDRGLLMALRNTIRRPTRFLLSVGLLACAAMVFVSGMSLGTSVQAVEEERAARRYWDVSVRLAEPAAMREVTDLVRRVPGVARVEGWNSAEAGVAARGQIPVTRTYPDQGHGRVMLDAVPAGDAMFTPPPMAEGRWLEPGETGAIVLNQNLRDTTVPDVTAGDTVTLYAGGTSSSWRVVGIAGEREGDIFTTAEGFAQAMGQPVQVDQLRLATTDTDERTRTAVADAVDAALSGAGFTVAAANSVSRNQAISEGHLGPVIVILLGIALPLGVIGAIGLASTMSANVLDRTREFGVMHAIGARPKTVRRIVVAEGVFLALASCLVAVLPVLALTAVLGASFGNLFMSAALPFRVSLPAVGIWVALVIVGSILATDAAATRASRITVREALTYL